MIKKIISAVLICGSLPIFAQELSTFTDISQALSEGNDVSVVINDNLCTMQDPNIPQIPKSTMVHHIRSVIFTEDLMSFDAKKFTFARPPMFNENLNQRAVFLMHNSGAVNIRIGFFSAETNKPIENLKDVIINCKLGDGAKFYQK